MKFIATTNDKISTIAIKAGQVIFSRDNRTIYLDSSATERTEYQSVISVPTDTFRLNITNPVKGFYFVEDTKVLYQYDGNKWWQLTTPPQESLIFLKREDFPTIGKEKTLYIDKDAIYQWSNEENDYIVMSGGKVSLIWEAL